MLWTVLKQHFQEPEVEVIRRTTVSFIILCTDAPLQAGKQVYAFIVSSKPANVATISDETRKAAGRRVQTATSLTSSTVLVLRRTVVHVSADLKTSLLAAETGTQSSAGFFVAFLSIQLQHQLVSVSMVNNVARIWQLIS